MQNSSNVFIRKANGEREHFDPEKLFRSLVRSGADTSTAERITTQIGNSLRDDDNTRDIYTRAFTALREGARPVAARYSVKRALLELGPSGYPFEDFIAAIYTAQGYETKTRVMMRGECAEHELDLLARNDRDHIGAEAKYHNNAGLKSDLKVVLYVQARFEDLHTAAEKNGIEPFRTRLLITNTKFSTQAVSYAACTGLTLIGWDYPEKGNLRELIEQSHVHPVSCLTTLSRTHKRRLMESGVVLCKQLHDNPEVLTTFGFSASMIENVQREIEELCQNVNTASN